MDWWRLQTAVCGGVLACHDVYLTLVGSVDWSGYYVTYPFVSYDNGLLSKSYEFFEYFLGALLVVVVFCCVFLPPKAAKKKLGVFPFKQHSTRKKLSDLAIWQN